MPSWSGSALKKRGIPFVVAGNSNCRQSLLLGTLFFFGGSGLAAGIVESGEGDSDGRTAAAIGVWSGMTALGYLWGRNKDKENVTVEIQQPDASEGP